MVDEQKSLTAPPPVVALAGWVVPGAGYWLLGQRARAITVCVTVLMLFVAGILIGGIRVIDAPHLFGTSGNIVSRILEKPWFVGQVLAGPISLIAAYLSGLAAKSPELKDMVAHARLADIGTLYAAVAGMLNLLTIVDSSSRAARLLNGDDNDATPASPSPANVPASRPARSTP